MFSKFSLRSPAPPHSCGFDTVALTSKPQLSLGEIDVPYPTTANPATMEVKRAAATSSSGGTISSSVAMATSYATMPSGGMFLADGRPVPPSRHTHVYETIKL